MSSNEALKLLCQRLVANQFDHIHDAEQALEQFEQLTTPTMVLSLLEKVAPRHEMQAAENVARSAQADTSVFAIAKNLTSQG
jgi:hypothetical protein